MSFVLLLYGVFGAKVGGYEKGFHLRRVLIFKN